MAKAENTVIVDGQEYKPGDVIPDFKSIKCVDTREPRKYQGLSADVSVLNDVIAKYASGGASCFMSDTGEYYEYDRKEKTWKLITNITERGFDSEKAYGALKHMLKNVSVSDEKIQSAVTDYLTVNPVLPGATTEQAQQIEQNKTDVASLKEETGSLKEDFVGIDTRVYSVEDFVGINEGFSESINLPYFLTTSDNTGTVTGENIEIWNIDNIFDKDSIKTGYRYNDNGQEVADPTGAYQTKLVPICPNGYIYHNQSSSFVQRVYTFDKDKNFISRANGLGDGTQQISLPSGTAYISFQFNSTTLSDDVLNTFQVTFSDSYNDAIPTSYKPFSADRPASKLYKNARNFIRSFASDTANITGKVLANEYTERRNKLFTTIDIWEPSNVDSDYSNPTSGWGKDTKREDWAATDKYLYYDFLSHYYDIYIGIAENGYKVTKRSLGQDSANTGHELFEYDFCPVNYKYTVMLSAGMNADETQGLWGLATFIRCLMNEEEENLTIAHKNIRFKVIPIINASGFDEDTLRYNYSDGVNPNFNFNYKDSWSRQTSPLKGEYPDSNISSQILKKWINDNSGADLWLDLHTGRWVGSDMNKYIADVRVADDSMRQPFNAPYMDLIREYYTDKGYITSSDNIGGTICIRDNLDYQKTVYAYDICGIKSVMPEMHIESTGYGSDGHTNNSAEGIKCYVAQIRAMVMCYINESTQNTFVIDSIKSDAFHSRYR